MIHSFTRHPILSRTGQDGTSQLSFLVYGDNGAEFTLSNDNKGTFRIESGENLCFEVKTEDDEAKKNETKSSPATSFLEDEEEIAKSLLRSTLRKKRNMRTGRHLLAKTEAEKSGSIIAKSIMVPGMFNVSGGYIVSISSGNVKIGGIKQWKMIVYEDFHKGTVSDWSNRAINGATLPPNNMCSTCGDDDFSGADWYLGSYGQVEAVKKYVLPPHHRIRIKGRFHFFDDWNGEYVYIKVDDKYVWIKNHEWSTKLFHFNSDANMKSVCGNPSYPDTLSAPVDIVMNHMNSDAGAELKISVGGSIDEDKGTWGFDDLQIFIK